MNDFLSAEQRLRLKCVYLHSTQYTHGEKELGLEEIVFVLGVTRERVRQIEMEAIQKLRGLGLKIEDFI